MAELKPVIMAILDPVEDADVIAILTARQSAVAMQPTLDIPEPRIDCTLTIIEPESA